MDNISYKAAGVDVDAADAMKRRLGAAVSSRSVAHCTPLNRVGAFASLLELGLGSYKNPVFVLKSEEPGSKQLLSIDNDRMEWIARDLINHLVNDITVMGALPCAVLDTVICGKIEGDAILRIIGEMSKACADNGCVLVGGETSEQPGVLPAGRYILQASILGIVEKDRIIDGGAIKCGDAVIAFASNGLHTNGYSLVRKLIEVKPSILGEKVGGVGFLDAILLPHMSYTAPIMALLDSRFDCVHGMAHITGGGMRDNLVRILGADNLRADINLSKIRVPKIFGIIKEYADIGDDEMLRTFNNGVGLIAVVDCAGSDETLRFLNGLGTEAYEIGRIVNGAKSVTFRNSLNWE